MTKRAFIQQWLNRPVTRSDRGRRDGIAIAFECEMYGGDLELTIGQHKGDTYFAWRFGPARADVKAA